MRPLPTVFRGLKPCFLAATLALTSGAPLFAQQAPPPSQSVPFPVDTGRIQNQGFNRGVIASFEVRIEDAEWLRLYFDSVELAGDPLGASGATLRVTSFEDGATQELNQYRVREWRQSTAYFNGNAVLVELLASPGTGPSRLSLSHVVAGAIPVGTESQCGPNDDRLPSTDPRAARLLPVGCTGWLIDDCTRCMLTAGHCSSSGFDTVQFNVPASNSNGSLNHPGPEDQYAVDQSSMQFSSGGVGADWGYYGTFPNSVTGMTAAEAQGSVFHLATPPSFNSSEDIRITGYGVDSTPQTRNQTQQTHVGPWFAFFGTTLQYQTDTEGGNSGSPVIHEPSGDAIGIHTHGGCGASSGNSGTGANNNAFQNALSDPQGLCASGMRLLGDLPTLLTPGMSTDVDLMVTGGAVPGSEFLYVRYDGGAFLQIPLVSLGSDQYRATLPPPVCGATPEFYLAVDTVGCGPQTLPPDAPNTVFAVNVGNATDLVADDMESDQGWQGGVAGDDATTGVWVRVNPRGTAAQPEDDHTAAPGVICWATGQGSVGGSLGENDVDNGTTTLLSPVLDGTGSGEAWMSYWRWYSNNTGSAPGQDTMPIEISNDGGSSWSLVETVGPTGSEASGGWFHHSFRVADILTPTNQLRLRVVARDLGAGSIVEAAFDDFRLFLLECDDVLADCNQNGILDSDDIASGRSQDADGDGIPDECDGSPGIAYCFCDSGAPCGNTDAGAGCANSTGSGAALASAGTAEVGADDLVITASSVPSNQNGIFYMGGGSNQIPFGDGQRCAVSGGAGIFRYLPIQNSGSSGVLTLGPGIVARSQSFTPSGRIQAGQTWFFQAWFRDPMGPCGTGFNTSNGMSVSFLP